MHDFLIKVLPYVFCALAGYLTGAVNFAWLLAKKRGFDIADYPESYKMYENEVSLPLHTLLTDEQVEYIISSLKEIVK